jgi:hypothetical protein
MNHSISNIFTQSTGETYKDCVPGGWSRGEERSSTGGVWRWALQDRASTGGGHLRLPPGEPPMEAACPSMSRVGRPQIRGDERLGEQRRGEERSSTSRGEKRSGVPLHLARQSGGGGSWTSKAPRCLQARFCSNGGCRRGTGGFRSDSARRWGMERSLSARLGLEQLND